MSFIYLSPLFLYFPHLLPEAETQPLLSTGLALLSLFAGRERRAVVAFLCLGLAITFWIVTRISIGGSVSSSLTLMQLLIGPLVLFGALALRAPPPSRNLMACVAAYFLLSALFELTLPSAYGALTTSLLSRASVIDGHRGISLFTPEPTYAALSVTYFLMLAYWSGRYRGFRHRWIEPALLLCLIATASTYVVLLLLVLAYVLRPRLMIVGSFILICIIPFSGLVALENDESIRVMVAISRLIASDFSNFLPSISLLDSSLGSRLATNTASFLTPVYSPLGLGLDCSAVPIAFEAARFDFVYQNAVLSAVMDEGCLKPPSYGASISLGLGAILPIFLFIFFRLIMYVNAQQCSKLWLPPFALAVVMLFVQAQLSSPIPWLLLFFAIHGLQNKTHISEDSFPRIKKHSPQ